MAEGDNGWRPIDRDGVFYFSCGPQVPCFNACCRDLNQFLAPYDVVRLARHLQMSTGAFLEAYTACHVGPQTGLPVVTLKPADPVSRQCPFVTAAGCRVYENRPASCRMYPLARMLHRSRQDGSLGESYALISEPHCRGFEDGVPLTVSQWIADQGLETYNELNDAMMAVISVKQQYAPGVLRGEAAKKLFAALYDPDALRIDWHERVASDCRRLGLRFDVSDQTDDEPLLRFAMQYAAELLRHEESPGAEAGLKS